MVIGRLKSNDRISEKYYKASIKKLSNNI